MGWTADTSYKPGRQGGGVTLIVAGHTGRRLQEQILYIYTYYGQLGNLSTYALHNMCSEGNVMPETGKDSVSNSKANFAKQEGK